MADADLDIVVVPTTFSQGLYARIAAEAGARGISIGAEVRRTLTYAYDFEDAVRAHGRSAHPSSHGTLATEPPDPTDENGAPL